MTEPDTPSDVATDDEPSADEQFGAFTTDDGDTIVYDRTNSAAWIQSDYALDVSGE